MKKRDWLYIILLVIVVNILTSISLSSITGFAVKVDKTTYVQASWSCPDGTNFTKGDIAGKTYTSWRDLATSTCKDHCKYLTTNRRQCNPTNFKLGDEFGTSTIKSSQTSSEPDSNTPTQNAAPSVNMNIPSSAPVSEDLITDEIKTRKDILSIFKTCRIYDAPTEAGIICNYLCSTVSPATYCIFGYSDVFHSISPDGNTDGVGVYVNSIVACSSPADSCLCCSAY